MDHKIASILSYDAFKAWRIAQLKELLNVSYVWPSQGLYNSLVYFQNMHNKLLRIYIFYQVFNKIMVKNKYPTSLIEDLFDQLEDSRWFTKFNLISR